MRIELDNLIRILEYECRLSRTNGASSGYCHNDVELGMFDTSGLILQSDLHSHGSNKHTRTRRRIESVCHAVFNLSMGTVLQKTIFDYVHVVM